MSFSDTNNSALHYSSQVFAGLGAVVSAAGAIFKTSGAPLASGILSALAKLLDFFSQTDNQILQLISQIQEAIHELQIDASKQTILQRFTDISNAMAACRVVYQDLALRSSGPWNPLDDAHADEKLDLCRVTLETLVPSAGLNLSDPPGVSPLWFVLRDFQEGLYFSPVADQDGNKVFGSTFKYAQEEVHWVGESSRWDYGCDWSLGPLKFSHIFLPDVISINGMDGYVFCPVLTLPAYVHAIGVFITAGLTLRRDFLEQPQYRFEIGRHARFLADVYRKMLSEGFVYLPVPSCPWAVTGVLGEAPERFAWMDWLAGTGAVPSLGVWPEPATDFHAPFGCIDRFTGNFVVADFTDFSSAPPAYQDGQLRGDQFRWFMDRFRMPDSFDPYVLARFHQVFLFKSLRAGKQLCKNEQLDGVRSTVNSLCQLLGDPPLIPELGYGDWSLKEICQVVSASNPSGPLGDQHPAPGVVVAGLHPFLDPASWPDSVKLHPWGLRELASALEGPGFMLNAPGASDPRSRSMRYLVSSAE
jgi:hypothetical protein